MKYNVVVIDSKYRMNIKWINYLCHLLNLLLLCGYTSSSSLTVDGSNSSTSNNVLSLLQSRMSIVKHNKSTSLTSISSDSVSNFMTFNFTALTFGNGSRALDSNDKRMKEEEKDRLRESHGGGEISSSSSTYQISNFNIDKSNKYDGNRSSFSAYECVNEVRRRDKRGGPKRVRHENLLRNNNMTRVNSTSDIKTGTNLNRHHLDGNLSIADDILTSSLSYNRVSRAPQNAKRKKIKNAVKNGADVTKPIKVSLLGLFELTSRSGLRMEGKSELAAAELAVRHINERGLLEGYTLELMTNDTQVRLETC